MLKYWILHFTGFKIFLYIFRNIIAKRYIHIRVFYFVHVCSCYFCITNVWTTVLYYSIGIYKCRYLKLPYKKILLSVIVETEQQGVNEYNWLHLSTHLNVSLSYIELLYSQNNNLSLYEIFIQLNILFLF